MDQRSARAARRTGVVLLTIALIASAATAGATVAGPDATDRPEPTVEDATVDPRAGDQVALRAASDENESDGDNETDGGAEPAGTFAGTQLTHRGAEDSGEVDVVEELDTTLSLDGENLGFRMAAFPDGDYAITGTFKDDDDPYVARVNPEGSIEWTTSIDVETPRGIETTSGGEVVVIGNPDGQKPHLFGLSGDGDVVYRRANWSDTDVYGLAVLQDDVIYVAGSTEGEYFVSRHDAGTGRYQSAYRPGRNGSLHDVVVTGPDIYAVGEAGETALAVRLVAVGDGFSEDWRKRFGGDDPGSESFDHLAFSPTNDLTPDLIALGRAAEYENYRGQDIYMARLDSKNDGEAVWVDRFGSTDGDVPYDVVRVGDRVVALTYPGYASSDGQTAKAYLVDERDGSRRVIANGANEGDIFLSGVGTDGNRLVITGGESRDQDPDQEFEDLETMLVRYRFEEEPTVRIRDATLDPSAVEDDGTVSHTLRLEVGGVSDDGNTDTFGIEFPSVVESISPNAVEVEDADGDPVAITGAESAGNTYLFTVSPDSGAETRGLTATVSVDATYPDVDRNTSTEVWAGVSDSAHGNDSVEIGLTVSDAPARENDRFEPNDTPEEAAPISPGTYEDLVATADDTDAFVLDLRAGDTLDAAIEFDHAASDLDLAVYYQAERGADVELLRRSESTTDDERVDLGAVERDGIYHVVVSNPGGEYAEYTLRVRSSGGDEPVALPLGSIDEFDDGTYTDRWRVRNADDETIRERDGRLRHQSPKNYNGGGNMLTETRYVGDGTVRFVIRQREVDDPYWGTGFGLQFNDTRLVLQEQKWGANDRLYLRAGDEKIRLADATDTTRWRTYSLTVDFETMTVTSVTRGDDTYDVDFPLPADAGDPFRLELAGGRGHDTRYDFVRATEAGGSDSTASGTWASFRRDERNTGANLAATGMRTTPSVRWTHTLDLGYDAASPHLSSPVVTPDGVYVGVRNNSRPRVVDRTPETGTVDWTTEFGFNNEIQTPAVADGTVYVAAHDQRRVSCGPACDAVAWVNATVYALDATTGDRRWATRLSGWSTNPAVDNGRVYLAANGSVFALDAATGEITWSYDFGGNTISSTSVAVSDDRVFVGNRSEVLAIDRSSGTLAWQTGVGTGSRVATPAVRDDTVYVSAKYGIDSEAVFALDAHTGEIRWRQSTGLGGRAPPPVAVDDSHVYLSSLSADSTSTQRALVALKRRDGTVAWRTELSTGSISAPTVAGDTVYVSNDGSVRAFDTTTGERRWRKALRADGLGAVAAVDNAGYLRTYASVIALDSDGTDGTDGDQNETTLSLAPSEQTVAPGTTVTYDVVIGEVRGGVGSYAIDVSVGNPSTATIVDASTEIGGMEETDIGPGGASVRIGAFAGDTVDTGTNVTIATVTVRGQRVGSTTLAIEPTSVSDEDGTQYELGRAVGATVAVREVERPAPVGESESRPRDPDDDGVYEDVNGDGDVTPGDATVLFNAVFGGEIPSDDTRFDINDDGSVTPGDATVLFNEAFAS